MISLKKKKRRKNLPILKLGTKCVYKTEESAKMIVVIKSKQNQHSILQHLAPPTYPVHPPFPPANHNPVAMLKKQRQERTSCNIWPHCHTTKEAQQKRYRSESVKDMRGVRDEKTSNELASRTRGEFSLITSARSLEFCTTCSWNQGPEQSRLCSREWYNLKWVQIRKKSSRGQNKSRFF